ncbi:RraA-like protein [Gonapodya prolifera JEL478]|uniref:RraA-like protein n=1 Tax=Gonapodya prolifera (strain JEL478) TaxID=1344416 RepID=A0A139ACY3_GONPJ|nr:RraA-like protein [Gonapodya prolifera JEL478]|eukprot:KXS14661.1 RraA-like protein [Gonapodya prolifera JEL478]
MTVAVSGPLAELLPNDWKPLSKEQLEQLASIDSPSIANAIETFKVQPRVQGYTGTGVRLLAKGKGKALVAYAVTVRGDSTTEHKSVAQAHPQLYASIHALHQAGGETNPLPVVVCIDDDGDPAKIDWSCHLGEIMATTFRRCGAVGVISDGGVRDIEEVREMGDLWYFGRGLVVAHGRPFIYDVGVPANINGMYVRTGDLIHADENGVCIIPKEVQETIYQATVDFKKVEDDMLKQIRSPDFFKQFEALSTYKA